jgi:hypothetical protein
MRKFLGDVVARDTAAARRGIKPAIQGNVYGRNAPRAAEFGRGAQTVADIKEAIDRQHRQRPGAYHRN